MNESRYGFLSSLAGEWLLEIRASPVLISSPGGPWLARGDESQAVYIAVNRHGQACYVGQTRPTSHGEDVAARRVGQHMREPSKRASWHEYWVIPLKSDTPAYVVNLLEKRVALRLGVPLRHLKRAGSR